MQAAAMVERARVQPAASAGEIIPVRLLSVRQVGRMLNRDRKWVFSMCQHSEKNGGPWKCARMGQAWRIREDSVLAWLRAMGL